MKKFFTMIGLLLLFGTNQSFADNILFEGTVTNTISKQLLNTTALSLTTLGDLNISNVQDFFIISTTNAGIIDILHLDGTLKQYDLSGNLLRILDTGVSQLYKGRGVNQIVYSKFTTPDWGLYKIDSNNLPVKIVIGNATVGVLDGATLHTEGATTYLYYKKNISGYSKIYKKDLSLNNTTDGTLYLNLATVNVLTSSYTLSGTTYNGYKSYIQLNYNSFSTREDMFVYGYSDTIYAKPIGDVVTTNKGTAIEPLGAMINSSQNFLARSPSSQIYGRLLYINDLTTPNAFLYFSEWNKTPSGYPATTNASRREFYQYMNTTLGSMAAWESQYYDASAYSKRNLYNFHPFTKANGNVTILSSDYFLQLTSYFDTYIPPVETPFQGVDIYNDDKSHKAQALLNNHSLNDTSKNNMLYATGGIYGSTDYYIVPITSISNLEAIKNSVGFSSSASQNVFSVKVGNQIILFKIKK